MRPPIFGIPTRWECSNDLNENGHTAASVKERSAHDAENSDATRRKAIAVFDTEIRRASHNREEIEICVCSHAFTPDDSAMPSVFISPIAENCRRSITRSPNNGERCNQGLRAIEGVPECRSR